MLKRRYCQPWLYTRASAKAEQPFDVFRNLSSIASPVDANSGDPMATFNDPTKCFAPLEVIERFLEIRAELGFSENIYLRRSEEITDFLDAYGFDIYAFSTTNDKIKFGDYRTPVVPGGDIHHTSAKAH